MSAADRSYVVAVRALCEFTARRGDLDRRFNPSPTAQQGVAGHQRVTARRAPPYQTEVTLEGRHGDLLVRGRADGYDPVRHRIEEIKTCRGDPSRIPENQRQLHWSQARIYGWLMCAKASLDRIELALVYLDLATDQETVRVEHWAASDLQDHFAAHCALFLSWAGSELRHAAARQAALAALGFPHAAFRPGQRQLAEAVYRTASGARCLIAQAPTGIGKTLGALFPLLKAVAAGRLDRIFYLTAKTSGRALALGALAQCRRDPAESSLRVLELTAREKACEHPDRACHGESCPLARGFHDRLPAARQAAVDHATLQREDLRRIAARHSVCPYYLAQEMVRWADVVVGDFNHFFDPNATLHAALLANEWRVGLVVDEAHNLVERGRAMYTAELDPAGFGRLRRNAPAALRPAFTRLARSWRGLARGIDGDYRADAALPPRWIAALQQAVDAIGVHLGELAAIGLDTGDDVALLDFYFSALAFCRLAETFGDHALFERRRAPRADRGHRALRDDTDDIVPCIRNVVPARYLASRFAAAHGTTLLSATLHPRQFHADMLGLPSDAIAIDVDSPYSAAQLTVRVAAAVSTRFRDRGRSLRPIVDRIAAQYRARPGNYLAFFGSYVHLDAAAALFAACHPDIALRSQQRGMSEREQADFLAAFTPRRHSIGFVVLGGAFAEGIDLPGDRLIGAFIATLGLPRPDPVNEAMRARIDARFGTGFDYTYLFPALQRVVQAAGRVIRSDRDRGVVHLLDDRFLRPAVRRLLPDWWHVERG